MEVGVREPKPIVGQPGIENLPLVSLVKKVEVAFRGPYMASAIGFDEEPGDQRLTGVNRWIDRYQNASGSEGTRGGVKELPGFGVVEVMEDGFGDNEVKGMFRSG